MKTPVKRVWRLNKKYIIYQKDTFDVAFIDINSFEEVMELGFDSYNKELTAVLEKKN